MLISVYLSLGMTHHNLRIRINLKQIQEIWSHLSHHYIPSMRTKAGMRYRNEPMGVTIDVPEGAIEEGLLDIKVGFVLYGPFSYPDSLQLSC